MSVVAACFGDDFTLLTFTSRAISTDDKLILYFLENRIGHFMQIVSMKCLNMFSIKQSRPPPRGQFGRRSRRNAYDFALSVREGEDDFALFFGDFRNLLSVLLAPVSRFFACLQQTLTVALMISNGDTPTTTRCLQKHDIITLIGNYP